MENFYKITKEQAELIGKIQYGKWEMFDPFVGDQKDGYYLVDEKMYLLLKERPEFQKIDFTKQAKLEKSSIDLKTVSLTKP